MPSTTTLYIKNMVCNRCILVVRNELERIGAKAQAVDLGEVTLSQPLTSAQRQTLEEAFRSLGFELIDDRKSKIIDKVKTLIIELVHQHNSELRTNLSEYLTRHIYHDYSYITHLFSEVEGTTIEKYFIAQKIERVKELLVYDEMTLTEIAFLLHYSSVAHLSHQFKQVTGLTPTHFKNIRTQKRKPLDEI